MIKKIAVAGWTGSAMPVDQLSIWKPGNLGMEHEAFYVPTLLSRPLRSRFEGWLALVGIHERH
jgi:hypothetical protein